MLITLEGLDGSGKTTAARALRDAYPAAVHTAEPTDSWYGDAVRRSVQDDAADPLAELFLYVADHAAHLAGTVRPALDRGDLVISDRYVDSRYAYQGATLSEVLDRSMAYVQAVHEPWTRPPDATIYLDVDPEVGATRSGATNKFEEAAFLGRVRHNYERLLAAEPERFVRVDASASAEKVAQAVVSAVDRVLS